MESLTNKAAKARIDTAIYDLKQKFSDFIYPLSKLKWEERKGNTPKRELFSTDGLCVYYDPERLLLYGKDQLQYEIMHVVFHGLLDHFSMKDDYPEKTYRDLCMDAQVCFLLSQSAFFYRSAGFGMAHTKEIFQNDYSLAQYHRLQGNPKVRANMNFYRSVCNVDDHSAWDEEKTASHGEKVKIFWKQAKELAGIESESSFQKMLSITLKANENCKEETFKVGKGGTQNYRELLKELLHVREVCKEEEDSIDPMFYHYGFTLYEDVPLIEPMESCEKPALHTLAIAVDVSGSCTREEIMKSFWGETNECICQMKQSHAEGQVLLLQCDDAIRWEEQVALNEYVSKEEEIKVHGFGGTSFIPVFNRIAELEKEGMCVDALIYLTDGLGFYPQKKPDYPVYFVLPREDDRAMEMIPDWIETVHLEKGERG